ncbi:unnamed protein product, partial [Hapterophycus canaliculatus]
NKFLVDHVPFLKGQRRISWTTFPDIDVLCESPERRSVYDLQPLCLMREGGGRAVMALLLASRRGLSFTTSFSAASARARCAIPAVRHLSSQGLVPSLSRSISRNCYSLPTPVAQAVRQRHGSVRALVAPLSMAAARSSPRDSANSKINNNSGSNANATSSNSSSNKRKPRHTASTSRSPGDSATTSPGGAKRRLSPGTVPVGGRPTGAAPWGAP